MSEPKVASVTVQFDTAIPAVYLYLHDPTGFRSRKSRQVAPGVVVDLDEKDEVIGVELLGPQDIEAILRTVVPESHRHILEQLGWKRRILEELLSPTAA